jgi:hypothetical protein
VIMPLREYAMRRRLCLVRGFAPLILQRHPARASSARALRDYRRDLHVAARLLHGGLRYSLGPLHALCFYAAKRHFFRVGLPGLEPGTSSLPEKGSYKADAEVAAYESPPFSEYTKLILKVSHNYGANLNVCLMAVKAGSTDCNDGFPVMKSFFEKSGVDPDQVALLDGRGGNPSDRFTPKAATDLLRYWLDQPQAKTFRTMLPELGVDGSLAEACRDCPAKGKVFAKTGTVALPDAINARLIQAESLGGYLEVEPDRLHVFYLVVNGATAQDIDDALQIFDDLADIAAIVQEGASQQGDASQGDQQ